MFQTGFLSIIRNSKLHIQRQVFVRPILLPAADLVRSAAGSSKAPVLVEVLTSQAVLLLYLIFVLLMPVSKVQKVGLPRNKTLLRSVT